MPELIYGKDSSNKHVALAVDSVGVGERGAALIGSLVWDTDTLSWVRMTQPDGSGTTSSSAPKTKRIEDTGSFLYVGYADIGSEESSNVWRIARHTLDSGGSVVSTLYAGTGGYLYAWSVRASLSYS